MASEASQENFEKNVFLTTNYEQIVKLEQFCSAQKWGGGGGGTNPLVPPLLKVGGARAPPAPLLLRPCVLKESSRNWPHVRFFCVFHCGRWHACTVSDAKLRPLNFSGRNEHPVCAFVDVMVSVCHLPR